MKILYLDTTSNFLYSAVWEDGKILESINQQLDKDLSVFTLSKISEMISNCNIEPQDIDKIMVVNGPGSFTGIRVGITNAKVYAYSLEKEICTIYSLQAMALSSNQEKDYYVPMIDARRGYVYAAVYDKNNIPIVKEQYTSINALKCALEALPGSYQVITNDNLDFEDIEKYSPNFKKIIDTYKDKETENPHAVNPVYLKLTEAEEKKNAELI